MMMNSIYSQEEKYPGVLIAVEGLDGSGKSTQIHLIQRWLELEGYKVYFTEWNSSLAIKPATQKAKKRQLLTPTTFSLIHCTDFADRYERQIWPLLRAGYIVLSDRYIYTAFARDAVRKCNLNWVKKMYSFAVHPFLTFFFHVPLEVALNRILSSRPKLKYHEAGMDLNLADSAYKSFRIFQGRINQEYLKLAKDYHMITIDATQHVEKQQEEVRNIIRKKIDLSRFKWRQ
jgi:dTMP kinase